MPSFHDRRPRGTQFITAALIDPAAERAPVAAQIHLRIPAIGQIALAEVVRWLAKGLVGIARLCRVKTFPRIYEVAASAHGGMGRAIPVGGLPLLAAVFSLPLHRPERRADLVSG